MDADAASTGNLCARLESAGLTACHVTNEIEALSTVRNHPIDLAVLHWPVDDAADISLPDVLREVSSAPYLPVLILAEGAAEQQRCRFLNSGADDVISGNTSAEEMMARLRALLRVKDLQDQLTASRSALQDALDRERRLLAKLRRDNENLHKQATTDSLTRVQNVRSFQDILAHEFRTARRYNHSLSLLMLDVDHFKVVNDTHGHPSGDYVLKELAVILKRNVRESDVIARTGGEEFAVILPHADHKKAASFAERIRRDVYGRDFIVYEHDIHVTISIGSATYPDDAETTEPEMLVYFADQALLEAKEAGRDRVVEFCRLDRTVRQRLRRQYLQMQNVLKENLPCEPATQTVEDTRR